MQKKEYYRKKADLIHTVENAIAALKFDIEGFEEQNEMMGKEEPDSYNTEIYDDRSSIIDSCQQCIELLEKLINDRL